MREGICNSTYSELRHKDVINVCDGVKIGRICDMELDISTCPATLTGIVVPGPSRFFGILRGDEELFIPSHCINKIGDDVILVEIAPKVL